MSLLNASHHHRFQGRNHQTQNLRLRFHKDEVIVGRSGQFYGLRKKLGDGAYGVVYDAVKLKIDRDGRTFIAV